MSGYWTAWARSLRGLTPTAKLVTAELALLADARGVAIAPIAHLAHTSGRTSRAVREALSDLEAQGLVRRPSKLNPGRPFRGVRVQLVAHPTKPKALGELQSVRPTDPEPQQDLPTGNLALQDVLEECVSASWEAPATWALASLIETEGHERFAHLIHRRQRQGIVQDPWDTLTLAWETARNEADVILSSREPWAMWAHLTGLACTREDQNLQYTVLVGKESTLEALGAVELPESRIESAVFGLDDFDRALRDLVALLIKHGVPEAVAWAGTARVLELVEAGPSRRHWLAGKDAKLQGLGVDEQGARAWMTLIAGSRRGADGVLAAGFGHQAEKLSQQIADGYLGQARQLLHAS